MSMNDYDNIITIINLLIVIVIVIKMHKQMKQNAQISTSLLISVPSIFTKKIK